MNLSERLKIASQLAQCGQAIHQLRNGKITENEDWVLNLFSFSGLKEYHGEVSYLLIREYRNDPKLESVFVKVFELNNIILKQETLSKDDWKFILDGLILYRRDLLTKSVSCHCEH
jgi:hypothetical protein